MFGSNNRSFAKKLLTVCAMGFAATAFSGAALARAPGAGGPDAPQVQQQYQQVAHGPQFRHGPPPHVRQHHYRKRYYGHGRRGQRHGHGRYYRGPRYHSGFNLVLQFGDGDRRSGGGHRGGGARGGGGGRH
jgi:hypothetical protein